MNHTYRLVFSTKLKMFVAASELARTRGKSAAGKALSTPARTMKDGAVPATGRGLRLRMLAAAVLASVFSLPVLADVTFPDQGFESGLSGWTSNSGVIATAGGTYQSGSINWTISPYTGTGQMAQLQPTGGDTFSTVASTLHLSGATQSYFTSVFPHPTNFAYTYTTFTLNAGDQFSMAWNYLATDYSPYNDASFVSLVNLNNETSLPQINGATGQINILGATVTGGNYNTGSYGSSGWETATFTANTAGTYLLGFAAYNLDDTALSPYLFIDEAAGITLKNGQPFGPVAPASNPPPPPTPTPSNPLLDTSKTFTEADLPSGTTPVFDGGTLRATQSETIGNDFTIKSTGGTMDTNGHDVTLSGTIANNGTDNGGLTKTGTGVLTLSGTNTYSGGTTINGGTVKVTQDANLGAAGGGLTLNGGTLETAGTFTTARNTTLAGNGTINTDVGTTLTDNGTVSGTGTLTKDGAGTMVVNGVMSQTGGTTVAGGTLVLGAANTYTGATVINSGATLALSGNGGIAASSGVQNSGTFDIAGASNGATINTISGNGNVNLGGKNLTLANASGTVGGVIAGSGGLHVAGGAETLTGTNTYTGATVIDSGATLALSGNGSIAGSSGVQNNGVFNIAGTNAGATINTLSGNGNVNLGGKNLTLANASGTVGGAIAGSGGLHVAGGAETLTGANTYTGGTVIDSGATLALSGNGSIGASSGVQNSGTFNIAGTNSGATINTISGNGNVNLGGKNLTLANASGTVGGVIAGSGGLHVAGGAETLTGTNTYTGATVIDSGATLALSGNGSIAGSSDVQNNGAFNIAGTNAGATIATLSGNGSVNLGAKDLSLSNASGSYTGTIGGTGALHVNGGTETLSGNNSYTGGTTISNATVKVGADGNLGAAPGGLTLANGTLQTTGSFTTARNTTLSGNGGFSTDTGTTLTDNGTVSGSGTLVKNGAGTMVVNGVASHAGGTVVNGGVLKLNGDNTYTGGNVVNTGATLAVGKDAALGAAANGVALNGGMLQTTISFATDRDISVSGASHVNTNDGTTLADSGDVSGSGTLIKDGAGTMVLDGVASHAGGTVVNGGVLALHGDNTYTGGNVVNTGATLQVGKDAALGNGANGVALANGTLHATDSFDTARNISLNGAGAVNTDAGSKLTDSGNVSGNGTLVKNGDGTLVISGVASHTGGTVVNGGTLILDGDNTYTGGNLVGNGATLQVAKDAALGNAANGVAINGGTLHATGGFSTARDILLAGSGNIDTDSGTTVSSSGGVFGNGALIKNGDGTLAISGNATHTGGTIVNGGTLALGGNNTYTGGNVVNAGATLQVAKDATLGDASNGVALNNGTLHATGSFGTARELALGGNAHVDVDGNNTVVSTGSVSGSGALIKDGAGTLVLGGALSQSGGNTINNGTLVLGGNNSYTGGNVVNTGGTLQVAKDASLGAASNGVVLNGGTLSTTASFDTARNITLASNSSIRVGEGTTLTENGQFSGSGRLYKDGSGTLVLTGDNIAWTGGTTIDAGLVKVTSPTGIGTGDVVLNGGIIQTTVTLTTGQKINVAGNTTIYTDTGTTTTLTGAMDSTELAGAADGCFIKSGKGTLNMTGTATLRNGTCVQEGVLRANGVLNSVVNVDEGAMLRGSGLVTGPITVTGTLAPGNSPGTLTVSSTVTMNPGSTFQADINGLGTASGPGNYSRLLITGAGNQYIANGATLAPNLVAITGADTYTPYVPHLGDSFRIVTAEGGINGRFAPLTQPQGLADGTRMAVFYNVANSNSIDLRVVPVSYASYFASGLNSNAASTARALDKMMAQNDAGTSSDAQTLLAYGVAGVSASALPNLANALAGQVHGALAAVAPMAGQSLQGAVMRQMSGATPSGVTAQEALWADLSGNHGRWSSDAQASGFTANRTQLTVGADMVKNGDTRFGAGLSHAQSNVSASAGSGSVEQNLAFVYGEQAMGGVKVDALAGIGRSTWDSRRGDPFQIAGVLENNAKGSDALVSLGVRAPWQLHGFALEPFARVMWQRSRRDGFQENTATPAALQLSDYSANGTRMLVGVAGGSQARDPLAAKATVRYSVGVGRDSGNLAQAAVSASLAGMGTSIVSPDVGRSFVQASVEGTAKLGKGAYAYYGLNGEARSGKNDVGVTGGVRISF